MIKGLLGRKERKFSKARVTVTYEVEYDDHITEGDIDITVKIRKMKQLM